VSGLPMMCLMWIYTLAIYRQISNDETQIYNLNEWMILAISKRLKSEQISALSNI
jgi:hypothetical protein